MANKGLLLLKDRQQGHLQDLLVKNRLYDAHKKNDGRGNDSTVKKLNPAAALGHARWHGLNCTVQSDHSPPPHPCCLRETLGLVRCDWNLFGLMWQWGGHA